MKSCPWLALLLVSNLITLDTNIHWNTTMTAFVLFNFWGGEVMVISSDVVDCL
jgi:hypothetical protein